MEIAIASKTDFLRHMLTMLGQLAWIDLVIFLAAYVAFHS